MEEGSKVYPGYDIKLPINLKENDMSIRFEKISILVATEDYGKGGIQGLDFVLDALANLGDDCSLVSYDDDDLGLGVQELMLVNKDKYQQLTSVKL